MEDICFIVYNDTVWQECLYNPHWHAYKLVSIGMNPRAAKLS